MEITLSNKETIEILAINLSGGTFDWKRRGKDKYTGACVTPVVIESLETAEKAMTEALESEVKRGEK